MDPNNPDKPKRKRRVSKKAALTHVTLRVPAEVAQWFYANSETPTSAMRNALIEHWITHIAREIPPVVVQVTGPEN